MTQIILNGKIKALFFLDLSNIFHTATELNTYVDLQKLISSLSNHFIFKGLYAFTNSKTNSGLIEALYNMGFTVFQKPYDCDALMGFKISELIRAHKVKVIIIATHDGDFRGISDELEQENIEVYFLGFQKRFSTFLKPKRCLYIENLDVQIPKDHVIKITLKRW